MFLNYILLVHKNPEQVKRLVERLDSPYSIFYIHVDKQVDIFPFKEMISGENVHFLEENERELGTWGDIGIVKGTINAIKKVLALKQEGYVLLLSGQDYPLKSNDYIYKFFKSKYPTNFINVFQRPGNWHGNYKTRIEKYKINKSLNRGHFLILPSIFDSDFYQFTTLGKLNFLRKSGKIREWKNIFLKRKFPQELEPYGGGVYWAIPNNTLRDIIEFIDNNPSYLQYHKYTLCADEIFFHSILMHLYKHKDLPLEETITYVNWFRKTGPLPVLFVKDDFEELKLASEKNYLFARKFDITIDKEILELCDKEL